MKELRVSELARISGVSIRTLRYYDAIGLLQPERRNDHRIYTENDCLRLQQILLYRELEIPLETIRELLNDEAFDALQTLNEHRKALIAKQERTATILETIAHTIQQLEHKAHFMDYRELYEGLNMEQAEAYVKEAKERWGEAVIEESHQQLMQRGKKEWKALLAEGETITAELAKLSHLPADEHTVQEWIAKHFRHIGKHFAVTKEIYSNMGRMYAEDERFRAYYEKFSPGLADFMDRAIQVYCGR